MNVGTDFQRAVKARHLILVLCMSAYLKKPIITVPVQLYPLHVYEQEPCDRLQTSFYYGSRVLYFSVFSLADMFFSCKSLLYVVVALQGTIIQSDIVACQGFFDFML